MTEPVRAVDPYLAPGGRDPMGSERSPAIEMAAERCEPGAADLYRPGHVPGAVSACDLLLDRLALDGSRIRRLWS